GADRDPVEAEQTHDVVDPQAGAMTERPSQRLDPRLIAGGAQLPGVERRQGPVLAARVEKVWRGADPHIRGEFLLPAPRVRTTWVDAYGQVLDHANRPGRVGQLAVSQPLQPGVVTHAPAAFGRFRELPDRHRARMGILGGPALPRCPVPL